MPRPTIEQIQADLVGLTPAQQSQYMDELEKQFPPASAKPAPSAGGRVITDDHGRALAIPQLPLGVETDMSTPEGKINNAAMLAAGGIAGVQAAGGVIPAAVNMGKGLLGAAGGGMLGEKVGGWVGFPGVGRAVGAIAGGIAAPSMLTGQSLRDLMLGGREGLVRGLLGRVAPAAEDAGAGLQAERAAADIAAKKALAAARTAQAERTAARAAQDAERHALYKQSLERRLSGRAPLNPVQTAAAPPAEVAAAPPMGAPAAAPAAVADPADQQRIVLALQQQMGTAAGRKVVREWLSAQPKEVASQVRQLLARGVEHPATVQGPLFDPSQAPRIWAGEPARVQKIGEISSELARMLGQ